MTFKHIALKIFKSNFKRYLFYFLCNSFTVMVFFMFSTLLFNDNLQTSKEIEKGLSTAVMIPTVALLIFSIFFISYAHATFIRGRKKEFGFLMVLGMSHRDIRKMILVENGIIAVASLCLGVMTGTIFSRLFFLLIMRLIDVNGVVFALNMKSYLFSIGVFSIIFSIAVLGTMIITSRFDIAKLLTEDRIAQRNKNANPIIGGIGLIILLSTSFILYFNFGKVPENDGTLLLYCTISILISLYITLSQFGGFLLNITKRKNHLYHRHLLLLTNIDYKFKQVKKIIYLITVLVMVTIFYSGFALHLFSTADKTAAENHPFDLAFVQTENKNHISIDKVYDLFKKEKNPVTEHKTLEVMNYFDPSDHYNRTVFIADDQLSVVTNKQIQVKKEKYIILFQINSLGKEERKRVIEDIENQLHRNAQFNYKLQETIFERILNNLNYLDNDLVVLNHEDYQQLKNLPNNKELARIQLFNVKDWKSSKKVVNQLQDKLNVFNETTPRINVERYGRFSPEQDFFQIGSKIKQYDVNRQGGGITLYLVSFISVLFFIATVIILGLRLFSELEDEKKKYQKLYKIGITEKEIRKIIAGELKILFFLAPIIGISIAFVYTSTFSKDSGMSLEIYRANLLISCIYLFFQTIYYFFAKRNYMKQINESLN